MAESPTGHTCAEPLATAFTPRSLLQRFCLNKAAQYTYVYSGKFVFFKSSFIYLNALPSQQIKGIVSYPNNSAIQRTTIQRY